ncbi:hypothetical protein B0H14DRAFT_2576019 [Mycena olivaceomarginata]|nr:hypothetical protein B0H14DRAFT_2576019 [Mycena olivaceomarginata]
MNAALNRPKHWIIWFPACTFWLPWSCILPSHRQSRGPWWLHSRRQLQCLRSSLAMMGKGTRPTLVEGADHISHRLDHVSGSENLHLVLDCAISGGNRICGSDPAKALTLPARYMTLDVGNGAPQTGTGNVAPPSPTGGAGHKAAGVDLGRCGGGGRAGFDAVLVTISRLIVCGELDGGIWCSIDRNSPETNASNFLVIDSTVSMEGAIIKLNQM